jgi:hypothetical protein
MPIPFSLTAIFLPFAQISTFNLLQRHKTPHLQYQTCTFDSSRWRNLRIARRLTKGNLALQDPPRLTMLTFCSKKAHRNGYVISNAQNSPKWSRSDALDKSVLILCVPSSIKKPKTSRYPSLKGTDPKFRRNHRHALHGTMKALVGFETTATYLLEGCWPHAEGVEGGQAGNSMKTQRRSWFRGNGTWHWQGHAVRTIKGESTFALWGFRTIVQVSWIKTS